MGRSCIKARYPAQRANCASSSHWIHWWNNTRCAASSEKRRTDGAASKTLLDGKTNAGIITLKAAPDAPAVEKHLVPVMACVSLNFVMKATYAAEPLWVSVKP